MPDQRERWELPSEFQLLDLIADYRASNEIAHSDVWLARFCRFALERTAAPTIRVLEEDNTALCARVWRLELGLRWVEENVADREGRDHDAHLLGMQRAVQEILKDPATHSPEGDTE